MMYVLDFRLKDVGGPVIPGRLVTHDGQLQGQMANDALAVEPRITFLLHGFNVNRAKGRAGLLDFASKFDGAQPGALVATLWPGDHWVRFASYPFEGGDADDTAIQLARFIDEVIHPGTPVSFVTHSLGARVAMEAIKALPDRNFSIAQICLMAPAIDDYSVSFDQVYRTQVLQAERVAVLSSREDEVLKFAYPAADLLQAFIFFWRDAFGFALGYHGPRAHEESGGSVPDNIVHEAIKNYRNSDHGDYISDLDPRPEKKTVDNRESAASFANAVIAGDPDPKYPNGS